ncbi:MAG: hypothetical protein ACYCZU_06380 [Devosia sp.]
MAPKSNVQHDEQGQFIELPAGLEFPDDVVDVEIIVVGNARLITPVAKPSKDDKPAEPRTPRV